MMNTMFRKMFMLVAFAACAGIANAQLPNEKFGKPSKMEWDFNKILPDRSLSFNERAFPFFNPDSEWNHTMFQAVADAEGFTLDTPISRLTAEQFEKYQKQFRHGGPRPGGFGRGPRPGGPRPE